MSEELKSCPFCGSDDLSVQLDDGFSYYVWCGDCGSQTDNDNLTEEDAIKAWNNRPIEDAKDKEIKRLKAKLEDAIEFLCGVADDVDMNGMRGFAYRIDEKIKELRTPDTNVGTKEVSNDHN